FLPFLPLLPLLPFLPFPPLLPFLPFLPMLEAVIFDFDGVLVDSEPLHFRSFRDTLAEAGINLAEQDYFARYLGLSDRAAFEAIGTEHARPWTRQQLTALMAGKAARFEGLERTSTVVFPG